MFKSYKEWFVSYQALLKQLPTEQLRKKFIYLDSVVSNYFNPYKKRQQQHNLIIIAEVISGIKNEIKDNPKLAKMFIDFTTFPFESLPIELLDYVLNLLLLDDLLHLSSTSKFFNQNSLLKEKIKEKLDADFYSKFGSLSSVSCTTLLLYKDKMYLSVDRDMWQTLIQYFWWGGISHDLGFSEGKLRMETALPPNEYFIKASLARKHWVFLTNKNRVFALGHSSLYGKENPKRKLIDIYENCCDIATAEYGTFVVTVDGQAFCCGLDYHHYNNLQTNKSYFKPRFIEIPRVENKNWGRVMTNLHVPSFLSLMGNNNLIILITTTQEAFFCGQYISSNNQVVKLDTPTSLIPDKKVTAIAIGEEHFILLTAEGEVYTCGTNQDGQRGGNFPDFTKASLPNTLPIVGVAAKSSTIFAFSKREVFQCGHLMSQRYLLTWTPLVLNLQANETIVQVGVIRDNVTVVLTSHKRIIEYTYTADARQDKVTEILNLSAPLIPPLFAPTAT